MMKLQREIQWWMIVWWQTVLPTTPRCSIQMVQNWVRRRRSDWRSWKNTKPTHTDVSIISRIFLTLRSRWRPRMLPSWMDFITLLWFTRTVWRTSHWQSELSKEFSLTSRILSIWMSYTIICSSSILDKDEGRMPRIIDRNSLRVSLTMSMARWLLTRTSNSRDVMASR